MVTIYLNVHVWCQYSGQRKTSLGFPPTDHFRNYVINRQEYYVIPDMLAKNVGRSVSIIVNEQ